MFPNLPTSWSIKKIGELCDVSRGASPRPIHDQRYFEGGTIPWIKIADATKSGKYLYKTKQYVNEYGASFSRLLPPGTILVAASGTLGYTQILGVEGCAHDGWLILQNLQNIDRDYLYYAIQWMNQHFYNSAYGAAIQNINTMILQDTDIPYPPLYTQRNIGSILSAYDDLIENNTRRIKILEEMAQSIYQDWFVHYRFPGHENVRMVDSGTELGELPEGWGIVELGCLVEFQKGKKPKNVFDIPTENSIPLLLIEGLRDIPKQYTNDMSVLQVSEEDIIMVMDGASSGEVFIGKKGALGSTIGVYRPLDKKTLPPFYLFQFLYNKFNTISDNNTGSAIPHANKDYINKLIILMPPYNLLSQYNDNIASYYKLSQIILRINGNLRASRDILLPMLISGKLNANEADIPSE